MLLLRQRVELFDGCRTWLGAEGDDIENWAKVYEEKKKYNRCGEKVTFMANMVYR